MFKLIKESCKGGDKTSSKRVMMYIFTGVAVLMVAFQMIFAIILLWRYSHSGELASFKIEPIFPDVIWYSVFGIIAGLAGVNGVESSVNSYSKKESKQVADSPNN